MRLGERLGFGLSILLVSVAQDIITNEYIPISQERLWLVVFIQCSTYWIFLAIFETILIAWVYYKAGRGDHEKENSALMQQPSNLGESPLVTDIGIDAVASSLYIRNTSLPVGAIKTKEIAKGSLVPSDTSRNENDDHDSNPEGCENNFEDSGLGQTKIIGKFHKKSTRLLSRMLGFDHVSEGERLSLINRVDRFFLRFCLFGYTLFIVIMFSIRGSFREKNEGNAWVEGRQIEEF